MKKMLRIKMLVFIIPVLGFPLSGWAARHAVFLDSEAFTQNIETIAVMPVIDGRTDKSAVFDADDANRLRESAKKHLETLGYQVQVVDAWKTDKQMADDALVKMSADELCKLAPSDAKVFLVITVNLVHARYVGLAAHYSIKATLVAIDLAKRKEIWKDADTQSRGAVGITGSLVSQIAKKAGAQGDLMDSVFSTFPKKGTK